MTIQSVYSNKKKEVQIIKCRDAIELLAVLLAALEGESVFPVIGEWDEAKEYDFTNTTYHTLAKQLLVKGKDTVATSITSRYLVENEDAVIISHDDDPLWYLQSLLWAFMTKRKWLRVEEQDEIQHTRKVYVGSPYVPSDSLVGYSKHVPSYLTGANPSVLSRLLVRTLRYEPAECEDDFIFRVEAQTTTFTKEYPELCEPASVLNVRMKKGAQTLFINGHSGDDFLITDSMVLCGKQANASYEMLPNKEIAPVCYNYGKCFTDVLPSWISKKSYVKPTEDLPFNHLVIYGCRSFYLGHNPYGPYFDLALGAVAGKAVSYIGSYENIDTELEQVFFLNVLLRSGYTIGEALDKYNYWAEYSFQGRATLRSIGDPKIQHFTKKDVPTFKLIKKGDINLEQSTWAFKIKVDRLLPKNTGIEIRRLENENEKFYFSMIHEDNSTEVWVFAPRKLQQGTYRVNIVDLPNVDYLHQKITNLQYRLNILEHLQLLDNESRKNIKVLRERMSQVIQLIPTFPQEAISEKINQTIISFMEQLPKTQKKLLTPLIENLDADIANPLMLYDKRRIYGPDNIIDCPNCGHKMSLSELRFPGVPHSERIREQCVNCEMMLERPKHSAVKLSAKLEENLEEATVLLTLSNNSDETIHASIGSVIEMGAQWNSKLTPRFMDITLSPRQVITEKITISNEVVAPVPRQYLFVLALIDLEWFYYSVGLLPRKQVISKEE
ncbi:hypothetical protein [Geobacillus sp. Geo 8.1]